MKLPNWLTSMFTSRATFREPPEWLRDSLGAAPSATGVSVTQSSALSCAAVYACVRVLADSIAQLPLKVQRVTEGRREDDRSHRLYTLLHDLPNPEMTAYEFKHLLQHHVGLLGNGYAEIERDGLGREVALWPLDATAMTVERHPKTGNKQWIYRLPDGQHHAFTLERGRPSPILHLRGLGDSLQGFSPIRLMRETIGRALATEEYGARLFSNSAQPRGYLKAPVGTTIGDEQIAKLRAQWESAHRGLSNAHRVAILNHGLEWHQMGMSADDAQFIESRKLNVNDVARAFRVPPHLIGDLERATFSNIEHQAIEFVVHSLTPWLVCWEQAIARDLLSVKSFETHQVKFVVNGLLRGDIKSRYDAYAVGRQWGWLSANDILRLEDMNGIGDQGDVYLTPANMQDAANPQPPQPPQPTAGAPSITAASATRDTWVN